jgi:CSLREA domain-containing protein
MVVGAVALCAAVLLALPGAAVAGAPTITVNDTGDAPDADLNDMPDVCDTDLGTMGDQCTLRAAIQEANSALGQNPIHFAIPGNGVHTIAVTSQLPDITQPVTIDGYTQDGAEPNTNPVGKPINAVLRIELDGDLTGSAEGLYFTSGANGSIVRGLVINNFDYSAVHVHGANPVYVRGNFIGTNPSGKRAEPNALGVFGFGGSVQVGSAAPADRNLLSGNNGGIGTNIPVSVFGNYIGTAADGHTPLGNSAQGIGLTTGVGSSTIGGPGQAANIIAFNGTDGVNLQNNTTGNLISRNRIFSNGDVGFDLQDNGVTPNDPGDADTGPNDLQNFPVIKKAKSAHGETNLKGTLDSIPKQAFQLEFFSTPRNERGGRRFLGTFGAQTDSEGMDKFNVVLGKRVKPGQFVTATATNAASSTSEFSKPRKVKGG